MASHMPQHYPSVSLRCCTHLSHISPPSLLDPVPYPLPPRHESRPGRAAAHRGVDRPLLQDHRRRGPRRVPGAVRSGCDLQRAWRAAGTRPDPEGARVELQTPRREPGAPLVPHLVSAAGRRLRDRRQRLYARGGRAVRQCAVYCAHDVQRRDRGRGAQDERLLCLGSLSAGGGLYRLAGCREVGADGARGLLY
ncbi:hypothetical protein CC85DRAFT_144654 [Cutaneotrichosporon oleaginosum]|uniref:Uncharacterized protein n=1 Tax=Cutaneotrichosporon oleaginosum TaxID=879819 RepID=A0A0J1AZ64_9TREE|nr:uncharacterized protein CC85DRAFT_144654 [Cutaneotrichosporon oleaginosum]KLT40629.1 hypothetical protein CC85DRAFT_144654 [Cutaneotrichosporon oleaginosum]TXT12439.1 hypothetical protein COLE_02849 [Cutaneotrichosporon oleaginosum]